MIKTKNQVLKYLLAGNHKSNAQLVNKLLENDISIIQIYEGLLKPALYDVGVLWEQNKISVATEHLASAIVESLLNEIFLKVQAAKKQEKSAIITCVEHEYHQIGARMVADILEMNGWDVLFLGANTPNKDLMNFIEKKSPDLVGISMSMYFHLPALTAILGEISKNYPNLSVLIGGNAFLTGGHEIADYYENIIYLSNLISIENYLKQLKP